MQKVLVANRGEIAVRAMRAAVELGLRTVAVHTRADRDSIHRIKADEAVEVGDPALPLAGYLDPDALVRAAVEVGADALYPGYGFLSESPALARACEAAGVTFVGPPASILDLTGDKVRARDEARAAGVPVLEASGAMEDVEVAVAEAERIGFPVFVKAAAGGGGRGLRRVDTVDELREALPTARREAAAAFGDGTVFLERAMVRPRHVEVQVLADDHGGVVHLHERDCSIQRRHQKVLEIAPAPGLPEEVRARLCRDAVAFARQVGYVNAGTVEFLVGPDGDHVLIEMNPRIQVEHTITEEVTGVDLVRAQFRVAAGASLDDLGLHQDRIEVRGTALQCRVTTEEPAEDFRPGTGTITAFRPATGPGIRIDAGSVHVGAEVSPHFDPLLAKVTARGPDLPTAAGRARRALQEMRVRGVPTNVGFLDALLAEPDLLAGRLDTAFVPDHPEALKAELGRDRVSRLLDLVADVTVHRPHGPPPGGVAPSDHLPSVPVEAPPRGSRDVLRDRGPDGFAEWLRGRGDLAVTDTTMRDAHQSLLATRVRTLDLLTAAPATAHALAGALSLEVWGGATFDASLRFLNEDPWDRLARLREAVPNLCLQMLLRGANAVGYGRYPTKVVAAFVAEAAATGVDVFRVFDALNDVTRMRDAIAAVRDAGAVAEGTLCYTGDLADPGEQRYTLDHYLEVAEGLDAAGAHVLCIKDMAGVLRAPAAERLVRALRERFPQPVHLHTHDTAGGQLATLLAASRAGVDAVDAAMAPLSGGTSQPSLSALVAATAASDRPTGLRLQDVVALEPYWAAVRRGYAPFESGLPAPSGTVYRHQIPGGQLSNLRQQAIGLGLGDRFEAIEDAYVAADRALGGLVKVTPTSKVVGDLALYMLSSDLTEQDLLDVPGQLPGSVVRFLQGDLGTPPFGWPEELRRRVLEVAEPLAASPVDDVTARALDDPGRRRAALTELMLPGPAREQQEVAEAHGEVWRLPTPVFLHGLAAGQEVEFELEPGKRVVVALEAVGDPDDRGMRTLWFRVNGQPRPVRVRDRDVGVDVAAKEAADPGEAGHVAATMAGVVAPRVAVGDRVEQGDVVAVIEAMKMESTVVAGRDGCVSRVVVSTGDTVEAGDLVVELEPTSA